ncbi:AI-2E family transporter [Desulfotomaculum copahuensis]|uniref:AI-2E family transporter n=1 Tax=Desulfotomaculum copahuensis TaxID=1838280 RepID=A0A1B7LED5_9FIRM|nr:AI-2E family transporter [Desulfotomaculum copahuensis]
MRLFRIIFLVLLALGIACLIHLLRGLIPSFIMAAVLAYLLHPVVVALQRRGTPPVPAILLVYLALLIVAGSLALYGLPRMVGQLNHLLDSIPVYAGQVEGLITSIQDHYTRSGLPPGMKRILDARLRWGEEALLQMVNRLVAGLIGLASSLFDIFLAPVLAFYLLKDGSRFKEKLLDIIPAPWRDDMLELSGEINQVLHNFVRGYLLVCLIVGTLSGMTMALLGLEFALMLGIFAGLTELIPYFGPVIGAVPALALALLRSKWLAFKVVLAVFVIHQLEGNLISPRILGNRVGLHPLAVILALLAGGELYGLAGMLLAVPVAAVFRILIAFAGRRLFPVR